MVEFGPPNLIRTLVIIALIYYAVRMWMRYAAKAKQREPKTGGTTVEGKTRSGDSDNNMGEYVDFEEVD